MGNRVLHRVSFSEKLRAARWIELNKQILLDKPVGKAAFVEMLNKELGSSLTPDMVRYLIKEMALDWQPYRRITAPRDFAVAKSRMTLQQAYTVQQLHALCKQLNVETTAGFDRTVYDAAETLAKHSRPADAAHLNGRVCP